MTSKEAIDRAKQALAQNGGLLPKEVYLMVFGRDGDPANNAVARWFADQGVKILGVRFDAAAFATWLDWQKSLGKKFPNDHEMQSAWRDYVWDTMRNDTTIFEDIRIKQIWKSGRWQDFTDADAEDQAKAAAEERGLN